MRRPLPVTLAALVAGALVIGAAGSAALRKFHSAASTPEAPVAREMTIPAGTVLRVRIESHAGSDFSRVEDPVQGQLAADVVIDGQTVVPAGSAIDGVVTAAERSGRAEGRSLLALRFDSLTMAGTGDRYRIDTRTWIARGPGRARKNVLTIGLPAVGGAIVGALVGGGKGAAVGAVAGGGAGTGVVVATHGQEVRLGPGAEVTVRTSGPLSVRVG